MKKYVKYFILAALIYTPLFSNIDILPIRVWDEGRLAMNAYEMLEGGDLIVTHFQGLPDMWNTKPPLFIWLQVAFMNVVGVNELAVRLPAAVAGLFTCFLLLFFSRKYLNSFWFGFIAILVLVTSDGYIDIHCTRTGDYDALLTLFTTMSCLSFFAFCETNKNKYLYWFFISMAMAVLTKNVAGLLFLPAIFIYTIVQKQFVPLLKNKHLYFGLLSFLALISWYYILREARNPGYFAAIQENELGGRYLNKLENHGGEFWLYFTNIIDFRFVPWYLLVPCGLITGFFIKNKKINRITLFSFLMIITFFFIISFGETKLAWYDVPMYPFLAIIVAIFVHYIFQIIENVSWFKENMTVNMIPFIFLFLVAITPYQKIINKVYWPKEDPLFKDYYDLAYYLKEATNDFYDLNDQHLLWDGYNAHILFYTGILQDRGVKFSAVDWRYLKKDEVVIAAQGNVKQYVEEHYNYEVMHQKGNVLTYKINGNKQ